MSTDEEVGAKMSVEEEIATEDDAAERDEAQEESSEPEPFESRGKPVDWQAVVNEGLTELKKEKGIKWTKEFLEKQLQEAEGQARVQLLRQRFQDEGLHSVLEVLDHTDVKAWKYLEEAYPRVWWCSASIRGHRTHSTLDFFSRYNEGGGDTTLTWEDEPIVLETHSTKTLPSKVLNILADLGYYDVSVGDFLYFLAVLGDSDGFCSNYLAKRQSWTQTAPNPAARKKSARSAAPNDE